MESFDDGNNTSYGIKAEYNGKTVKASTNYLGIDIINLLIKKAKKTDTKYEDDYLKKKENIAKNTPLDLKLVVK